MYVFEILYEATGNPKEAETARQELIRLSAQTNGHSSSKEEHTPELLATVRRLVKLIGRRVILRGYPQMTAGQYLDSLEGGLLNNQKASGKLPEFAGKANTAHMMAKLISAYTNGVYLRKFGRVWTDGVGQRTKDPEDHVQYDSNEDFESAWEWIRSKGKQVHYKETPQGSLITGVQIGRFLIQRAAVVRGLFGGTSETEYLISVRVAKIANAAGRTRIDITDQQASALRDIAQTRNDNDVSKIKAIMALFQGEQDVKQIINNSKKLDPRDKAKLDAIVAGAGNFKDLQ